MNIPSGLAAWIDGRTYPQLFEEVFGTPDVTPARISMAIATHERTLFSDRTPLDRENYGIEPMTDQERHGRELFVGLKCNFCHCGPFDDGPSVSQHRRAAAIGRPRPFCGDPTGR